MHFTTQGLSSKQNILLFHIISGSLMATLVTDMRNITDAASMVVKVFNSQRTSIAKGQVDDGRAYSFSEVGSIPLIHIAKRIRNIIPWFIAGLIPGTRGSSFSEHPGLRVCGWTPPASLQWRKEISLPQNYCYMQSQQARLLVIRPVYNREE